ncbi:MAG: hypothetical protein HW389_274 [Bacteroidetes bacterium]|nr:hypothetical protein [Bacteroidota bacterium]
MKTVTLYFALLLIGEGFASAQDQYLWIRLTGNRVMTNSQYQAVAGDTLVILRGGRITRVPLCEIVQLRVINSSSTLKGVMIGSGSGLAVGALLGFSLQGKDGPGPGSVTTIIALGVIGAIVGGTASALEKPGDVVDVSGMSIEEKRVLVREMVKQSKIDGE